MIRVPLFLLAMLCAIVVLPGCKTGTEAATDNSDCGPEKDVYMHTVVHDAYTAGGTEEYMLLETPEARNDCEATYSFAFRWADPLKRALEQPGQEEQPYLHNLAQAFQPGGEFAYFPHPAPVYNANQEAFNKPQSEGGVSLGKGWWVIRFSIGNKNSGYPTTRYSVAANVDFQNPAITTEDSVEIAAQIFYYDNNLPTK